jgi:hypothetical protein
VLQGGVEAQTLSCAQGKSVQEERLSYSGCALETPSVSVSTVLDLQHSEKASSPIENYHDHSLVDSANSADKISPIWGVATAPLPNLSSDADEHSCTVPEELHELLKVMLFALIAIQPGTNAELFEPMIIDHHKFWS